MQAVAKTHQDQLKRIKDNIESSYTYFYENCKRFHEFRKFAYDTALTTDDINALDTLQKPQIECNIVQSFISRLRGEFFNQEPSISVRAKEGKPIDPNMINVIEGHMRSILLDANNDSFEYDVYTDLLTGGFSVMRVKTGYQNEMSFEQDIFIERVFDPTLCGFDPNSRLSHKSDGAYCFELFPKTKQEFEEEFENVDLSKVSFSRKGTPNIKAFNWSYKNDDKPIILLGYYYEKKKKKAKIVNVAPYKHPETGQVMPPKSMTIKDYEELLTQWGINNYVQQAPIIMGEPRMTTITTICRYTLIENQILNYEETDFKYLPLVFVDGDSILIRDGVNGGVTQFTRPYIYNTKGIQRLLNFSIQSLGNEIENMVQHKFMAAKESIPPEYLDAYLHPQQASTLVYNAFKNEDPNIPLPAPQAVPRVPMPPEVNAAIQMSTSMVQTILGSYDASLGINDNQLSGIAITNAATQSNAAAMPFVVGFLKALNQSAQIIVDLIPKYYKTPRSIPIIGIDGKRSSQPINVEGSPIMNFEQFSLDVRVEAGVNFSVQKSKALNQIIALSKAMPENFGVFMSQMGLEVLIDNLEIKGVDQLKVMAKQFMAQQKQQQAMAQKMHQQQMMNDPKVMKVQNDKRHLDHEIEQDGIENQFKIIELHQSQTDLENEKARIDADLMETREDIALERDKMKYDNTRHALDFAVDASHKDKAAAREDARLHHDMFRSVIDAKRRVQ